LDNFNVQIPDAYDDSYLDERVQTLALQVTELRTKLNSLNIQDMEGFDDSQVRSRLAELEGQLNALASMDMTSADGSIDIGPLVVRIATSEGTISTLQSSITSIKNDIRTVKSDVNSAERIANSAKSTADSVRSSSGGSRTIENNYDDSTLRNRISTLERQVNSLPTTSGGTTVQRVENSFDASSIRTDIATLQTAVALLQATPNTSYNDSSLRNTIDDIQWKLNNLDIPTDTGTTDVSWLEEMIWDVKDELSMRIDALEWAAINGTDDDGIYAEKWLVEDLQYEVMYVQEQLIDLQNVVSSLGNTTSSNTTTSETADDFHTTLLYVDHQENSYTGDYWLNGEYNGHPLWVNWDCGTSGGQFEYCYIFRYPVGFTTSGWVWVIQPISTST
jgi:chromosome segregation ATPase